MTEATLRSITKNVILLSWLLTFLFPWIPVLILLLLVSIQSFVFFRLQSVLHFILRRQFRKIIPTFIDDLILLMLTGRSFRDAFLSLTHDPTSITHIQLREILTASEAGVSGRGDPELGEVNQLLNLAESIAKSPHRGIDKLKLFRHKIQWSTQFQRKSAQVTGVIRAQAILLTLLYIGLITLMGFRSEPFPFHLLTPSAFLFLCGLSLLFYFGRQPRWKT